MLLFHEIRFSKLKCFIDIVAKFLQTYGSMNELYLSVRVFS